MKIIKYLSAKTAAGKSHCAIKDIIEESRIGNNVLYVVPTKKLADEIGNESEKQRDDEINKRMHKLRKKMNDFRGINPVVIHQDSIDDGKSSIGCLMKELKNPSRTGEKGKIIIATQQALMNMQHLPEYYLKSWKLIVDEVPQIHGGKSVKVQLDNLQKILKGMQRDDMGGTDFQQLMGVKGNNDVDGKESKKWLNSIEKDKKGIMYDFAKSMKHESMFVYSNKEEMDYFLSKVPEPMEEVFFDYHTITHPSVFKGFKDITILGANFEDSLLFKIWNQLGVNFEEYTPKNSLQFEEHKNGDEADIYYCMDINFSKYRGNQLSNDGELINDLAHREINKIIGDEPCLYVRNVGSEYEKYTFGNDKSVHLSGYSHGQNNHQHVHNVVYFAANNLSQKQESFLSQLFGISKEEIEIAIYFQNLYQAISRCSIRNMECHVKRRLFVMDRRGANYLAEKEYKGATIHRIDSINDKIVVKKTGRTKYENVDVKKINRKKQDLKRKRLRHLSKLNNIPYFVTFFQHQYCQWDVGEVVDFVDLHEFYDGMREFHLEPPPKSGELQEMYSAAKFDGSREMTSVEHARFLVFDFDDGTMTHQDFLEIFKDYEVLVCNSKSGGGRFRAIFPLAQAVDNDVYRYLHECVGRLMDKGGFSSRWVKESTNPDSGMDKKFNACDLFGFPCQPKTAKPEDTFFIVNKGEMIDPVKWVDKPMQELKQPPLKYLEMANETTQEENNSLIEGVCDNHAELYDGAPHKTPMDLVHDYWNETRDGVRNELLLTMGILLAAKGLIEDEIREYLDMANKDKAHDVNSVITFLKKMVWI